MIIKRVFALLFCLVLISAGILPAYAVGKDATESFDFISDNSVTVGWNGFPFTINGDGSFDVDIPGKQFSVVFGVHSPTATVTYNEPPYPVTTHEYTREGIGYRVDQFVYCINNGAACVFSRFTVKNGTSAPIAFPAVSGASPITQAPASVANGKSASCDYITFVKECKDGGEAAAMNGESYESAKTKMKKHWDRYLEDTLEVSELAGAHGEASKSLGSATISYYIGASLSPATVLSSRELALLTLRDGSDVYACALALFKTGSRDTARAALESIRTAAGEVAYVKGALPFATLEENLDALLTLQSYYYILKILSADDPALASEADSTKALAASYAEEIASALSAVDGSLPYDWETATTDLTAGIVLDGEEFASARALCEWYVKSSVFTGISFKSLYALAKDANDYYAAADSPETAILSLITERDDGTVVVGKGAPVSLLSENTSITVKNVSLSSGRTASLTITVKKDTVDISLSGLASAPVQVEFPVFYDNIEYASVGYDRESGIVTAPEGTTSVTVRLEDVPAEVEKERNAGAVLEASIATAVDTSSRIENPTSVSKEDFDGAFDRAKRARSSTADEKLSSAEALTAASSSLSPMVAGYTHVIPAEGTGVGSITRGEIYQKFSLPSTGTVKRLTVKGEYCDGISAAVYTLRGDAYTTDELCTETYGEEIEGGISFALDFDAVQDTVYVLCIFCEGGDVTLHLESSDTDAAHVREAGETIVYTGASLALEFTVEQVDRSDLDTFYSSCLITDVSGYTKESRKVLSSRLAETRKLLCTPSVTLEEYELSYENLKAAFDGLNTYASEDTMDEIPLVGLILIILVVILLTATLISALIARKRLDPNR